MDIEQICARCGELTEAQLVVWLTLFEHMAQIEDRLADLEARAAPGSRFPDVDVESIQDFLRAELKARIDAKGAQAGPDVL